MSKQVEYVVNRRKGGGGDFNWRGRRRRREAERTEGRDKNRLRQEE